MNKKVFTLGLTLILLTGIACAEHAWIPDIEEYKEPDVSVSGNEITVTAYLEIPPDGRWMSDTAILELQPRPVGQRPLSVDTFPQEACDPEHPENVHKEFMMTDSGDRMEITLTSTVDDGDYDLWLLTLSKCWYDPPEEGNQELPPYYRGEKIETVTVPGGGPQPPCTFEITGIDAPSKVKKEESFDVDVHTDVNLEECWEEVSWSGGWRGIFGRLSSDEWCARTSNGGQGECDTSISVDYRSGPRTFHFKDLSLSSSGTHRLTMESKIDVKYSEDIIKDSSSTYVDVEEGAPPTCKFEITGMDAPSKVTQGEKFDVDVHTDVNLEECWEEGFSGWEGIFIRLNDGFGCVRTSDGKQGGCSDGTISVDYRSGPRTFHINDLTIDSIGTHELTAEAKIDKKNSGDLIKDTKSEYVNVEEGAPPTCKFEITSIDYPSSVKKGERFDVTVHTDLSLYECKGSQWKGIYTELRGPFAQGGCVETKNGDDVWHCTSADTFYPNKWEGTHDFVFEDLYYDGMGEPTLKATAKINVGLGQSDIVKDGGEKTFTMKVQGEKCPEPKMWCVDSYGNRKCMECCEEGYAQEGMCSDETCCGELSCQGDLGSRKCQSVGVECCDVYGNRKTFDNCCPEGWASCDVCGNCCEGLSCQGDLGSRKCYSVTTTTTTTTTTSSTTTTVPPPRCGNGVCELEESWSSCPQDCMGQFPWGQLMLGIGFIVILFVGYKFWKKKR